MNTQIVCTAAAPLTHTPEHGAVLQDEVLYRNDYRRIREEKRLDLY